MNVTNIAAQEARDAYYDGISKIAAELAATLDNEGFNEKNADTAWDFLFERVTEYDGGSAQPSTWPFGDPVALKVSIRVAEGLEDGDAHFDPDADDEQTKIYYVVRCDIFESVKKLRPWLGK